MLPTFDLVIVLLEYLNLVSVASECLDEKLFKTLSCKCPVTKFDIKTSTILHIYVIQNCNFKNVFVAIKNLKKIQYIFAIKQLENKLYYVCMADTGMLILINNLNIQSCYLIILILHVC